MANATLAFTPAQALRPVAAPAILGRVRAWLARRAAYRATCNELTQLSDRELADIGVARADIARIARESADRA